MLEGILIITEATYVGARDIYGIFLLLSPQFYCEPKKIVLIFKKVEAKKIILMIIEVPS